MEGYDISYNYAPALTFATLIITVLYNVFVIMQIKYGEVLITRTSLKPYYLSLAYLVVSVTCSFLTLIYLET